MKTVRRITSLAAVVILLIVLAACGTVSTEESAETETNMVSARVGISWSSDEIDEDTQTYADAVEQAGGEPVFLPCVTSDEEAMTALTTVDCLIMTGGEDINPAWYGQEPIEKLEEVNDARDVSDFALIRQAMAMDMPTLCICRGMQLLNVTCGGTLYQDIPSQLSSDVVHRDPNGEDFVYHDIDVLDNNFVAVSQGGPGTYSVNSWHHQGINQLGENLAVAATASDGTIEGIIRQGNTYFYGVQFHPEWMVHDGYPQYLKYFQDLIQAGAEKAAVQAMEPAA